MYFPQICSLNLYEVLPVFRTLFVCYTSDNKCISAFLFFIRIFTGPFFYFYALIHIISYRTKPMHETIPFHSILQRSRKNLILFGF